MPGPDCRRAYPMPTLREHDLPTGQLKATHFSGAIGYRRVGIVAAAQGDVGMSAACPLRRSVRVSLTSRPNDVPDGLQRFDAVGNDLEDRQEGHGKERARNPPD